MVHVAFSESLGMALERFLSSALFKSKRLSIFLTIPKQILSAKAFRLPSTLTDIT